MVRVRDLFAETSGASAAEFGLVVPLLMLLLFSAIDAGRFMWEYNRAEKATQAGARMAIVTDVVDVGMIAPNYVGVGGLTQGDRIPASALGQDTCTGTSCTCTGTCPTGVPGTFNATAFNAIVQRMQYMSPSIKASNVVIEYRGSGLGFAGDPAFTDPNYPRPQISPLVTVKLTGMTFRPLAFMTFAAFPMPDFATTLTAEDLSGTASN